MTVTGRALRAVAGVLERRDAISTGDPWTIPAPGAGLGQLSSAGTVVNDQSVLGLATFYRGTQLIADTVSLLTLNGTRQAADGSRTPVAVKPKAITDPFMACSLEEGCGQIVTSLVLRGNAYAAAVDWADPYGLVPTSWRILSPDQVTVQWDANGFRQYRVGSDVWRRQMMHLTTFMQPGGLVGVGIVEHVRNSLGVGLALDDVAGEFFRNGTMSTGIIAVDAPMTPDDAKATALQFVQNHAGVRRAHLPIVMGGGAKYTPISLTPNDAQFIQSRQFSQGEIATLLGIPPHLLGIVDRTTSWGTGIEVQGRAFVDYTLKPYIHRLQTMFTSWLPAGTYAEFDVDELTRPDTATRYANYSVGLTTGFLNPDTVRNREGLPPLPNGGGQVYRVPVTQQLAADENGLVVAAPAPAMPTPNPAADTGPAPTNDDDDFDPVDDDPTSSAGDA